MYEFLKMVFGFGILAYGFEFEDFRVVSGRQTQTSIAIALNPINTEACLTPRFRGMGFGALGLCSFWGFYFLSVIGVCNLGLLGFWFKLWVLPCCHCLVFGVWGIGWVLASLASVGMRLGSRTLAPFSTKEPQL